MVNPRTRDKIWKYSLDRAIRDGEPVTPGEIPQLLDISERTVREVLNVIAESGWLDREVQQDVTVQFVTPPEFNYKYEPSNE
jgi:DNA-binding GntR family transcriptional regulator